MVKRKKAPAKVQETDKTEIISDVVGDVIGEISAPVSKSAEVPNTPKIVIDGVAYDATNLSDPAKGAVASLQFAEAKIMALQNELAVCQTARFAYIKGLKSELADKAN